MNKWIQFIALILVIMGALIVFFDDKIQEGSTIYLLKDKGIWFVIVGLFGSSIYTMVTQKKKK